MRLVMCILFRGLLLFPFVLPVLGEELDPELWYSRMREPWVQEKTGFLREWMVLGEFPNPPSGDEPFYNHAEPCVGCDTDYLTEHGGEVGIVPVEGLAHLRPDGSSASWFSYVSPTDTIDFIDALKGRPHENTVAYAYTTVVREKVGAMRLAIGSDDGVMVWVNGGPVHRHVVGRGIVPDNDIIPVSLHAGTNSILIKIEQGQYGWGFCARLLGEAPILNVLRPGFDPQIEHSPENDLLVVRTDVAVIPDGMVTVDVMQAGGALMGTQSVLRGEELTFFSADWPDGAYEIRCRLQAGQGRPNVIYRPWYKGNLNAGVQALLRNGDAAEGDSSEAMLLTMLAEMVREKLGESIHDVSASDLHRIHGPLMEFEELMAEQSGKGTRVHPSGFVRLAWRDEVDDSAQFCRVYLPHDYSPDKEWPVVIYLHGYNPENPRYVRWWGVDQRHHDRCDRYGVIYVEPHGRGNTGFAGIGEQDVLRGLGLVQDMFSVDDSRVYLTGESMGGGGTWHVGTRNPDRFAAISPVYGGWDYRLSMSEENYQRATDYEHYRQQVWSSTALAETLLTTPTFVHHGVEDSIVEIRNSRFLVRELQQWAYPVRYAEYPHGNHFNDMGHWPRLMPWLLEQRLNRHPREVRLRAFSLKDASAHWLQVKQMEHFFRPLHAQVRVLDKNMIQLDTDNVLSVRLSPGGPDMNPKSPLRVVWNGRLYNKSFQDGAVLLNVEGYTPGAMMKRPELSGPVSDVKQTPFAIVEGTSSSNEMMRIICNRLADQIAGEWENRQKVVPRRFTDKEISEKELSAYSLILIGPAEANSIVKRLEGVPLEAHPDEVVVDGRSVAASDAAVQMLYPSPWNSNRYVHIMAATSAKGMFHHTSIPDEFDYCVHDGRLADSADQRPSEKVFLLAGRFNGAWRLTEESMFEGDPDVRKRSPVPTLPFRMTATAEEDSLHLSEVLEQKAINCFQWMRRNSNGAGGPLSLDATIYEKGLGVVPWKIPSSAEWDVSNAGWETLKGVIGVEYRPADNTPEEDKQNTRMIFKVLGDGEELYVSEPFEYGDQAKKLNVPISSVKILTLVVHNEAPSTRSILSANWADLRLERD